MERNIVANKMYVNLTIKVDTPEGTLFVTVVEDERSIPIAIELTIGKAGSAIRAWTQSLARMMSLALLHGANMGQLIEDLSSMTSDRNRRATNGVNIRSGPEGVCYALMEYRRSKYTIMEDNDDDGEEERPRRGRIRRIQG